MRLDPVFGVLIAMSFAVLFASAAVHKWRDLNRFRDVFAAYGLLPPFLHQRLYWVVPLFETLLALALLLPSTRELGAGVGVLLLLGYAGAIVLNLHRGRRDIACGCGGPDQRRRIAGWMVWRNLTLALLLAMAIWPQSVRFMTWTDAATLGFGIAASIMIYLCFDRLGQVAA